MNGRGRASLAAAICMIAVGFAPILYILWVLVSADPRQLNRGFFALFAGLSLFGEATLACLVGVAWAWSASRSRQGWGRVGLRLLAAALVPLWNPKQSADNDSFACAETGISRSSEHCPRFYFGLQCGPKSVAVHRCAADWTA